VGFGARFLRSVRAICRYWIAIFSAHCVAQRRVASLRFEGIETTMRQAKVLLDRNFTVGRFERRLFGAFVEHLGRGVYGGLYEPGHPTADERGFRRDVLELVKELGVTVVRYPGGNFVSTYRWEDGVGPIEARPKRLSYAWGSIEPNTFGTNEFIDWCRLAGVEPMLVVNLGTRGPQDAANLLEYCNHPGGTMLSELRKAHGWDRPHGVKLWCLGNEMDGLWQTGAKTAEDYCRVAAQAARIMRWADNSIELAVSGSSARSLPTFGHWDETVLEHTFDQVEWIGLHTYLNNWKDDAAAFLASAEVIDAFIEGVIALADGVSAKRRSSKRIMLSLNEWNVWYRSRRHYAHLQPTAPPLLEEVYSVEDALAVGGVLTSLINHADRVRSACIAQLINVIAPIATETGGPAWRQTIFYSFAQVTRFARRRVAGEGRLRGLRSGVLRSLQRRRVLPSPAAGALRQARGGCKRGRRPHAVRAQPRRGAGDDCVSQRARLRPPGGD
jgi:alpha-L-arabinofuranosidase